MSIADEIREVANSVEATASELRFDVDVQQFCIDDAIKLRTIATRIEAKQITIGQHQAAAVRLYHEQFCRYINEHQLNKCAWDAELRVLKPFLRRFTADAIREIHEAGL